MVMITMANWFRDCFTRAFILPPGFWFSRRIYKKRPLVLRRFLKADRLYGGVQPIMPPQRMIRWGRAAGSRAMGKMNSPICQLQVQSMRREISGATLVIFAHSNYLILLIGPLGLYLLMTMAG